MFLTALMTAQAQQFTIDGLTYTVYRGDMVSVTSDWLSFTLRDTVPVPEYVTYSGETYHVTRLKDWAFYQQLGMKHITLPPSIHEISENCFYQSGLKSIDFPAGLNCIREAAFYGTRIDSITIPSTVANIEEQAFFLNQSHQKFEVEQGNSHYCAVDGVLYSADTTLLHSYPAGKRDTAFHVPEGVTRIATGAFGGNSHLRHVYLPGSVTEISNLAFVQCSNMVRINIPENAAISGNPFAWCPSLTDIVIDSGNHHVTFLPDNHALVSADGDTLFHMLPVDGILTVPEGVRFIAPYALAYHFREYGIVVGEGVEEMDRCACFNSNYKTVTLPSSLWKIGEECFGHCYRLNTLNLSEGLTDMGNAAFYFCATLPRVSLPNSLKSVPDGAFYQCVDLEDVTFGDSTEYIGVQSFFNCGLSLTEPITFPSTLVHIGDSAFEGTMLTAVEFTGEIDSIGEGAFLVDDPGLSAITLVQQVPPRTGEGAFKFDKDYTIYIPCGSDRNYRTAPHWRDYDNYVTDCEGADEVKEEPTRVYADRGCVVVCGAEGRQVEVYNAMGVRVAQGHAANDCQQYPVPAKGLYLVRVGHETRKVVVM